MIGATDSIDTDLTDLIREIANNRQWAEKLLDRVKAVRKAHGAIRSKEIARLESEILLHTDPKHYEAIIDEKILEANKSFTKKMKKRFPGLTKNELLFCAYIRTNLGNANIAALKEINAKSVNMARYRLKKKLGLQPAQELDGFIRTF